MPSLSAEQSRDLRDAVEQSLQTVMNRAIHDYLTDLKRATFAAISEGSPLTAAATAQEPDPEPESEGDVAGAEPETEEEVIESRKELAQVYSGHEVPTLSAQANRWSKAVQAQIIDNIRLQFKKVYKKWKALGWERTSEAEHAMEEYISKVKDRLTRGTYAQVTVYDDSFNAIRHSFAQSVTEGWSRPQLAKRIAAELDWDGNTKYWDSVKAKSSERIDKTLGKLGKPGTPAYEYARLNDPKIQNLRDEMNLATKHLDADKSIWQKRASLIARTESTGITNFGAHRALISEGYLKKKWVATNDSRTRASHAHANKQTVAIASDFIVGVSAMAHPGDPSAPIEETAQCRCTIIGVSRRKKLSEGYLEKKEKAEKKAEREEEIAARDEAIEAKIEQQKKQDAI